MNSTQSILIRFSPTGTTSGVLTAIGEGLGLPVRHLDMTLPDARSAAVDITPSDLLVIGFPVYAGRLPEMHPLIFERLPEGNNLVVPVVVYGNRDYDDALLELADLCRAKGYTLAGAASFIGQHSFDTSLAAGRPNADDKALARQFGADLMAALQAGKTFDPDRIPGKRPYKVVQQALRSIPAPVGDADICIRCGVCVENCPMGAIDEADPVATDTALCVMCAACIQVCPVDARDFPSPLLKAHMAEIAAKNAEPKKPALFLPL